MKILLASSEIHPYSKSGGLADMVGALAKSLAQGGHQVGVVTPLYRGIAEQFPEIRPFDWEMEIPLGSRMEMGQIRVLEPVENLTIYFVEKPEFFDRAGLYQDQQKDYPDNAERFIFLSKAVLHLARYLPWQPELIHLHDWQVAPVALLKQHERQQQGWGSAPPVCLTIHNLAYQGHFPKAAYQLLNLPNLYLHLDGAEFFGGFNFLKSGIVYADMITTVSPRYAREIMTEALGCGLDGILRKRKESLVGILNGVDYDDWNPEVDPFVKHRFSVEDLDGKTAAKTDLQSEMGLPPRPVPLFSNISRLVEQKGVDIQLGALEEMLASDMQFVLLGSGSPLFEKGYQRLARRYPEKVSVKIGFDHGLSHRIEAGSDFFLMPSRFEPCGLNQMYSLRYGTVPIVRVTGGLDDSVVDITEDPMHPNGIKFFEYSVRALAKSIRKALVLYQHPVLLEHYRHNGMTADFSWERTTAEYLKVYEMALFPSPVVRAVGNP